MLQYQIDIRNENIHFVFLKRFFTDTVGIGIPQIIMPVLDKTFCTPSCMRECLILRMYDPISSPAIGATDHNRMSTKPFGYCTGKNLLTFGLCFYVVPLLGTFRIFCREIVKWTGSLMVTEWTGLDEGMIFDMI